MFFVNSIGQLNEKLKCQKYKLQIISMHIYILKSLNLTACIEKP